jgi:hypothetical protein
MPQKRVNGQDFIVMMLADAAGNPVNPAGQGSSGNAFCDQAVIVATGVAQALPAHAVSSGVIVKSLSSNSALRQTTSTNAALTNAMAGASGVGAGYILEPGEAAPYSAAANLTNTSQIYVNGQIGDVFSITGS